VKAFLLAAVLACTCCGGALAAEPAAPTIEAIVPGSDVELKPDTLYYVLSPEQLAQLNAAIARMTEMIKAQREEIESLREKTKPIGSCG